MLVRQPKTAGFFCENRQNHPDAKVLKSTASYCKTNSDIAQASYEFSELIAKKVKPHMEGEFMKECIVTAAKLVAPDKITLFHKVSLSKRAVSDQIQEMGDDIEKNTED